MESPKLERKIQNMSDTNEYYEVLHEIESQEEQWNCGLIERDVSQGFRVSLNQNQQARFLTKMFHVLGAGN